MKTVGCCRTMINAQQPCTDNEMYGALVDADWDNEVVEIGCGLPPIDFCPWCGQKIKKVSPKLKEILENER